MARGNGNKIGGRGAKPAGVTGGGRRKQNLGAGSNQTRKGKHPGMARGRRRVGG